MRYVFLPFVFFLALYSVAYAQNSLQGPAAGFELGIRPKLPLSISGPINLAKDLAKDPKVAFDLARGVKSAFGENADFESLSLGFRPGHGVVAGLSTSRAPDIYVQALFLILLIPSLGYLLIRAAR